MLRHQLLHRAAPVLFSRRPGLPREIPGPEPGRWLSTAGPLLPWAFDTLGHAGRLFDRYGDVVVLVRGGGSRGINPEASCPGTVLAFGPEHTRDITALHDTFGKMNLSGALYPGEAPEPRREPLRSFGAGLFSVNGDEHRRHRRLLMPAFSRRSLERYCSEMVRQTARELDGWREGDLRDTALDMRRLASRIVTATLFGEAGEGDSLEASRALQDALHLMGRPLTRIAPFDVPGLPFHRYLDAADQLERNMRRVLTSRSAERNERDDMLGSLLRARDEESGTRLTEAEILGHVSVLFAAGHETSANSLAWTLLLLALFPEVAGRVSEELESVLRGGEPTPEHVERLVYLGAVVKESLRLFTPAPWNGRVLRAAARLGRFEIPEGAEVLLSIYHTHRIPELFSEPLSFRPERWESLKPSPYEYNPFSAGPRTCIGAAFATLEIKIVLAMILQRYRLALVPQKVSRFAEMVLAPKYGLQMKVRPRDGNFQASAARLRGNVHDMAHLPAARA
jgi:cytochrome P450